MEKKIIATYYLKERGTCRIVAKYDITEITKGAVYGYCYEAVSWNLEDEVGDWLFVADTYLKFDACTHWWFNGSDFDPVLDANTHDNEINPYYHICGPEDLLSHIRCMCLAWTIARELVDIDDYYASHIKFNELVSMVLEDYIIVKKED